MKCSHALTVRLRDPRDPGRFLYHCACGQAIGFERYHGAGLKAQRVPVLFKPGGERYEAARRAIERVDAK